MRQHYIYFGETSQTSIIQTDEGTLHWIPGDKLLQMEYTQTFAQMLVHYTNRNPQDKTVYVGVAGNENGRLKMQWLKCEDFE